MSTVTPAFSHSPKILITICWFPIAFAFNPLHEFIKSEQLQLSSMKLILP